MKVKIHPQLIETRVVCACGNTFTNESTKPEIRVEVCYKCHPFYTGEHRFLDTRGRVEEFQKKQKVAAAYKEKNQGKKSKFEKKAQQEGPKSLRELLSEA